MRFPKINATLASTVVALIAGLIYFLRIPKADPLLVSMVVALILGLLYFPIGVVREFLKREEDEPRPEMGDLQGPDRPDAEPHPEWMGDLRGRKRRLALILVGFLLAGVAFAIWAALQ
jgi:hypothetical protein